MATINKYGYAVDDSGKTIGVAKRTDGESDSDYLNRAQARVSYDNGTNSNYSVGSNGIGKVNTPTQLITPVQPIVPARAITPVQPQYDIQSQIDELKQAQIASTTASLGKARDSSLSNLSAEKATIAPQYYAKRNATSTASQLGAKNFAEFMAQRGGTNSGVANQAEIASNVSLQGNLGSLNLQEQGANNDNARRVTDVGNAYNSDIASAQAGAYAQSLQNTISQMNQDRAFQQASDQFNKNFGLSEAGVTGNYGGTRTMAGQQADSNIALSNAQLSEMTNPNSMTNQLKQIGLDTARLNYAALPEQLKTQAQLIAQQLAAGAISVKTAQLQLDYLPRQLEASLIPKSGGSGGSSGGSGGYGGMTKQELINEAYGDIQSAISKGTSVEDVKRNIMANVQAYNDMGISYTTLLSYADKLAETRNTQSPENTMKSLESFLNLARGR